MFYNSIEELIGKTPLLKLNRLFPHHNVYCKLEYMNPSGSFKDRVALQIFLNAEKKGLLPYGCKLVEISSGNTAISIAMLAKMRGYKSAFYIPASASEERKALLKFLGAEVIETSDMKEALAKVKELHKSGTAFWFQQFTNEQNTLAHYENTALEIWETLGKVDYFVWGAGTGGALMGVHKLMKERNPNFKCIRVDPCADKSSTQALRAAHIHCVPNNIRHRLEGIGVDVENQLESDKVDEFVDVSDEEAFAACKSLTQTEGVMAGITTGASIAAIQKRLYTFGDKNVVTLAGDNLSRYMSTDLFR